MRVIVGLDQFSKPIIWDPSRTTNPHVLITGVTGSGKTHTLRDFITQMIATSPIPIRVHLFDVHDDIMVPDSSDLIFSQSTPYGFNPLVVDPDPHFGGVRRAITNFIDLLAKTANYKMGDRQEAALRALLNELFETKGFFADNPNSWRLDDGYEKRTRPKTYPTVADAYRFAKFKYEQLFIGGDNKALAALREASKAQQKLVRAARMAKNNGQTFKEDPDFGKAVKSASELFHQYFESLKEGTGRELDSVLQYQSKDVLAGVVDRLSKLHHFGIFSGSTPPFNPNQSVWRYRLANLYHDESILFVHTVMRSIFNDAKKRGITEQVHDVIVLDEAKRFTDDSPDSITNIISAEARKFGLMLLAASQTHAHFTLDNIQASATSIILKQDSSNYQKLKALTNVDANLFGSIVPKKSALVRIMRDGESDDSYKLVNVNSDDVAKVTGFNSQETYNSYRSGAQPNRQPPARSAPAQTGHESYQSAPASRPQPSRPAVAEIPELDGLDTFSISSTPAPVDPMQPPSSATANVNSLIADVFDIDIDDDSDQSGDPFSLQPPAASASAETTPKTPGPGTSSSAPDASVLMKKMRDDMLL